MDLLQNGYCHDELNEHVWLVQFSQLQLILHLKKIISVNLFDEKLKNDLFLPSGKYITAFLTV
jgi:hypothetical protein